MTTISQRVVTCIADTLGVAYADVTPTQNLADDLGADSLDVTEVVLSLEEEFGILIGDDAAPRVQTVADVIAMVEQRISVPLAA